MFTGIIETLGTVESATPAGAGKTFWLSSPIAPELRPDQSVAHDGACLTVEAIEGSRYRVTAIAETLAKTNLGHWQPGDMVNLERCLAMNGRLDGHLVQGHVDTTGRCIDVENANGSWVYRISFPERFAHLVIEKGSICLNGISLTAFDVTHNSFAVAIIPYTFTHTNMPAVTPGVHVNIEFDMVGKYLTRMFDLQHKPNRHIDQAVP